MASRAAAADARRGWTSLKELRAEAVVTASILIGIAAAVRIGIAFTDAQHADPLFYATTVVFLVATCLVLFYYLDTGEELSRLQRVGEDYLSPLPAKVLRGVQGFAFATAALILCSAWPAVFGLVLIAVKAGELWGAGEAKAVIREGINRLLASEEPEQFKQAARDLGEYYFKRPWDLQLGVMVIFVASASSLASYAVGQTDPIVRTWGQVVACIAYVLAIGANEALATRWRLRRDAALGPLVG
jgi:hypothetical protein